MNTILNATIRWDKTRNKKDADKYSAVLILDEANKQKVLEACKAVALEKGAPFAENKIIRSQTENSTGEYIENYITGYSKDPVPVVDTSKNPVDDKMIIWNGSKVIAAVRPYAYNFKGRAGIGIGLNKVMLKELADAPEGGDSFDPFASISEEGFVAKRDATVFENEAASGDVFDSFEEDIDG